MTQKNDRSVIDSLAYLYKFLTDKYSEELKGCSKNGKKKNKNKDSENEIAKEPQNASTNVEITTKIIHDLNENKNPPPRVETKVYNTKTKKLQKKKNKKQSIFNPPLDYNPIPFNFLSTKYKSTKTQVNFQSNPDIQNQDSNNNLKENFELISYITNNKIKSDAFSLWSRKYLYSVLRKKSVSFNQIYSERNQIILNQLRQEQVFQKNYQNDYSYPYSLSYSKSQENKETKKLTLNNGNNFLDDDKRDIYVDIVLSEDSLKC